MAEKKRRRLTLRAGSSKTVYPGSVSPRSRPPEQAQCVRVLLLSRILHLKASRVRLKYLNLEKKIRSN